MLLCPEEDNYDLVAATNGCTTPLPLFRSIGATELTLAVPFLTNYSKLMARLRSTQLDTCRLNPSFYIGCSANCLLTLALIL